MLLHFRASLMPFLPILSSASKVRLCPYPTLFEPGQAHGTEIGGQAHIKPSVCIEHRGIFSIELQPFLIDDKHGHLSPILTFIKDLFGLIIFRHKIHLGLQIKSGDSRFYVIVVDRIGIRK